MINSAMEPVELRWPVNSRDFSGTIAEAPPKQVAIAMERLSRAARHIADIRIGADRLLEALFLTAENPHQSDKTIQLVLKEESAMRKHFQDLRSLGKQLEDSGVLNGSVKLRGNSWGLHMPLVCPDGAVVAYAWKRQLAGQAGASAVDRTRLALKAFTDQKRRFFPHLADESFTPHCEEELGILKKPRGSLKVPPCHKEGTAHDLINHLQGLMPDIQIYAYQRLDWLKKASSLSSLPSNHFADPLSGCSLQSDSVSEQIAVIELIVPSVFRAVVSLQPAGSMSPDAVAFFSTDEGGSYVHARGLSVFHVFRLVTEHADKALQYFQSIDAETSLSPLLRWVCSYQNLFSKFCSKCERLLSMDDSLSLILPPVLRSYHHSNQIISSDISNDCDFAFAYHTGCYDEDM